MPAETHNTRKAVRNGLRGWLHAHIELGQYVHTHPVAGDQRMIRCAAHFQSQRVHIDGDGLVQDWQNQCAAIHDDALTAKTCTYK